MSQETKNNPKDLGSKKIDNHQKNEGFSGENLPNNYNPGSRFLNPETEKDEDGNKELQKRARDINEGKAVPVSQSDKTVNDKGEVIDKNRGTKNETEDKETAENRDFNSDIEKNRYPVSHPENKRDRGNTEQ